MWRVGIARGLASGFATTLLGLAHLHAHAMVATSSSPGPEPVPIVVPNYNQDALLIAIVGSITALAVAIITVTGPTIMRRIAARSSAVKATAAESNEALVEELARKERVIQDLIDERERDRERRRRRRPDRPQT